MFNKNTKTKKEEKELERLQQEVSKYMKLLTTNLNEFVTVNEEISDLLDDSLFFNDRVDEVSMDAKAKISKIMKDLEKKLNQNIEDGKLIEVILTKINEKIIELSEIVFNKKYNLTDKINKTYNMDLSYPETKIEIDNESNMEKIDEMVNAKIAEMIANQDNASPNV